MPYRAFTQLIESGNIKTSDGQDLSNNGDKMKEMRSVLTKWTPFKDPFYRNGLLVTVYVGDNISW